MLLVGSSDGTIDSVLRDICRKYLLKNKFVGASRKAALCPGGDVEYF
jgi:hypothetical protein